MRAILNSHIIADSDDIEIGAGTSAGISARLEHFW
jgi:hypothetical protein